MSSQHPTTSLQATEDIGLEPSSYTSQRLQHASPEHLHLTTRRCFVGPIPEGWLKSHRKTWYKHYLRLGDYSSRAATFTASGNVSHQRQITGLDGPSVSAMYRQSFPQPEDVEVSSSSLGGGSEEEGSVIESLAAADMPRSMSTDNMLALESVATAGTTSGQKKLDLTVPQIAGSSSNQASTSLAKRSKKEGDAAFGKSRGKLSFVTARETLPTQETQNDGSAVEDAESSSELGRTKHANSHPIYNAENHNFQPSTNASSIAGPSTNNVELPVTGRASNSTASLISHSVDPKRSLKIATSSEYEPSHRSMPTGLQDLSTKDDIERVEENMTKSIQPIKLKPGFVRFNLSNEAADGEAEPKARLETVNRGMSLNRPRRGKPKPGEIVKIEKMLVRVDSTIHDLPPEFDENDSVKIDARTIEKWREFVVVCRESTDGESIFSLQMYKSRVIPTIERTHVQRRWTHEVPLIRKITKVNLYSSLDKTVVVWMPSRKGTMIYILRPRTLASSVEWYTFLRSALGWKRTPVLQINIPDLSVTLRLNNPFEDLEKSQTARPTEGNDVVIMRTMEAEKAVAGNIVKRCLEMLEGSPEWANILDAWQKTEKMGLAWKRYDRLEWIHGANEQKMYGTLAMEKTHDLELRPKQHYPTHVHDQSEVLEEPSPVEGFLIRLTSHRGQERRLGKMFFKRLYFSTHNHFLCFCRPAKATPPPPPKLPMTEGSHIPSAGQIVENTPLVYAVNPYPVKDKQLIWLENNNAAARQRHDRDAYDEAERNINAVLEAEGYINLCHIVRVRHVQRGSTPADNTVDDGPDVDFHQEVDDTHRDDGKTTQFDDTRTFELLMKNNLVIRLQAYNKEAKKEWMARLHNLVKYWKIRKVDDLNEFKLVRQSNLKILNIDEEMESFLGQFARKWEVSRSQASPQLYNICSVSMCRAITMSGILYRKPRRHSTFIRCGVILCHGHLLIFQGSLRTRAGREIPHIQHERQSKIDLSNCYIYSGLVTEGDLLYQNQTFDSNHPGHHALPRIYLEDGWTSTDEDTMTTFVVWHGRRRSFFRSSEGDGEGKTTSRLKYVSRLGVPGRSIVFKTRSRAERDHWVMKIGMEIERLQKTEEVRLVEKT